MKPKPGRIILFAGALVVSLASSTLAAAPSEQRSSASERNTPAEPAELSGWPMFGYNAAHTDYNPRESILGRSNVAGLVLEWSRSTGHEGACCGAPVVSKHGTVVVPGGDFHPHAFDASTGVARWVAPTGSVSYAGTIANGRVYFGDYNGVTALRLSTGHVVWKNQTCNGQQVNAPPTVADGVVYAGLNDPELIALDAETGSCLWEGLPKMEYDGGSSPAVLDGIVYVGDDGSRLWSADE